MTKAKEIMITMNTKKNVKILEKTRISKVSMDRFFEFVQRWSDMTPEEVEGFTKTICADRAITNQKLLYYAMILCSHMTFVENEKEYVNVLEEIISLLNHNIERTYKIEYSEK